MPEILHQYICTRRCDVVAFQHIYITSAHSARGPTLIETSLHITHYLRRFLDEMAEIYDWMLVMLKIKKRAYIYFMTSKHFFALQYLVSSPIDRMYLHGNFGANTPSLCTNTLSSNVIPLTRLTLGMRLLARTWRAASEWQIWAYVNNIARYTAINPGMGH